MSELHSQQDIVTHLKQIQEAVTADIARMSDAAFSTGTAESWSAADYLKHLILSIKPAAKAMSFPADALQARFGRSERASKSYSEIVALYQKRLDEGARAEDYEKVVPLFYRFPEGTTDERAHLVQSWNASNQRLIDAVQQWRETELDSLQLPHPAIGTLTLRETLFFTIFHNTLHWHDMQHAAGW